MARRSRDSHEASEEDVIADARSVLIRLLNEDSCLFCMDWSYWARSFYCCCILVSCCYFGLRLSSFEVPFASFWLAELLWLFSSSLEMYNRDEEYILFGAYMNTSRWGEGLWWPAWFVRESKYSFSATTAMKSKPDVGTACHVEASWRRHG